MMKFLSCRWGLIAFLTCVFQGALCIAQTASGTAPSEIQPERVTLATSSRPISEVYVCIEPCNLLTIYAPKKTIFHELAPDSIGSFDTLQTTKAIFLKQAVVTTPLGNAKLSEQAMGEDTRKYPGWLWKGLLITLGCSIFGFILSACLARKKRSDFSTWQLGVIFGPLVPFLILLLLLGFMSIVRSSVRDPKVDIYVDNATAGTYEVILNGEKMRLPPLSHICLNIRPRDHDLRIRATGSGRETRFSVTSGFREGETYVINLESANTYHVEHKAYTMY